MSRLFFFAAVFLSVALFRASAQTPAPASELPPQSTIYFAQNSRAIVDWEEDRAATRRMTDQLVLAVTNQPDLATAWRSLVSPADRVGIKVAAGGGRYFSSHLGIIEAIVEGLQRAGVPRGNIIIWDRDAQELRTAGFGVQVAGCRVTGITPAAGYDRSAKFIAPVLGRLIWGDALFQEKQKRAGKRADSTDQLSSTSHFAGIVSRGVTKIINVPMLSDEAGCGIAGALYNVTVPNVDNWRRFTQTDPGGAGALPDLYADEHLGPKVVLHLMDGLVAQYAGGPHFDPNYAFLHGVLYASKDPVALDATALRLLEGWRKEAKLPPIGARADWLETAEQMALGHAAETHIVLRQVEAR